MSRAAHEIRASERPPKTVLAARRQTTAPRRSGQDLNFVPGTLVSDLIRIPVRRADAGGEPILQRQTVHPAAGSSVAPAAVMAVLRSPGVPMRLQTRMAMEAAFGHDFSDVRLHDDPPAAASSRAVNAPAYTVGRHIVFGAGQYDAASSAGRKLLAHELAHVIQ